MISCPHCSSERTFDTKRLVVELDTGRKRTTSVALLGSGCFACGRGGYPNRRELARNQRVVRQALGMLP